MTTTTTQRRDDDFYSILAIGAAAIMLLSACAPAIMPRAAEPMVSQGTTWTAPAQATTDVVIAAADADQVGASIANYDR